MTHEQQVDFWFDQIAQRKETLARELLSRRQEFSEEDFVHKLCELMAFEFRYGMETAVAALSSNSSVGSMSRVLVRYLTNDPETEDEDED